MELIRIDSKSLNLIPSNLVVTIGQFDGLHIAHQLLINKAIEYGKKMNLASAVFTFEPHPSIILNNSMSIYITQFEEKERLISLTGIDYLIVLKFDEEIAKLDYLDFYNLYLKQMNKIIVGFDFKFGYLGMGNANVLQQLHNDVLIVDEVQVNDMKVGSNLIRHLLENGEIEMVNSLINRKLSISGKVIDGNKIGRTIGYKTANILLPKYFTNLKYGVYAVYVYFGDNKYKGIANYGLNPTINLVSKARFEINIFDFDMTIYDEIIKIELVKFIREEKKFNNTKELINQIKVDCTKAKKYLEE